MLGLNKYVWETIFELSDHISLIKLHECSREFYENVKIYDIRGKCAIRLFDQPIMSDVRKIGHLWYTDDIFALGHPINIDLTKFINLRSLNCRNLPDIKPGQFDNLRKLTVQYNDDNVHVVTNLVNLESLDIAHNRFATNSMLENLTKLKTLDCRSCENITDISKLTNLTKLNISYECGVSSNMLKYLPKLKTLHALRGDDFVIDREMPSVVSLEIIPYILDTSYQCFPNISKLRVRDVLGVIDISLVANFKKLTDLDVNVFRNCNIDCLSELTNLRSLSLSGFAGERIPHIPSLRNLLLCMSGEFSMDTNPQLTKLCLIKSSRVYDMYKLTSLKTLSIQNDNIREDINKLVSITELNCTAIEIVDIDGLINLKKLTLNKCVVEPTIGSSLSISTIITSSTKISTDGRVGLIEYRR